MSKITVHNWKQTDIEGSAFEFILPEYHITYWEIPKWWYKGDRTVYTSCVRVDLNDETSIYIDGTTPLMQLTLEYDGDKLRGSNWRDIRRVLVCAKDDLGAINRGESDAYDDVEFFKDYYITRVDNYAPEVIDPLISVLKPEFYSELPVAAGSTSPFDTGTWNGGVEPVTYEWRYTEHRSINQTFGIQLVIGRRSLTKQSKRHYHCQMIPMLGIFTLKVEQ